MKKDMKIKLWDGNREKVIALLEGAGHRRAASGMEFYDRAAYIYTYADDEVITHGGTKEIFNNHPNEEHWLADGALCSLSYWTQPATANIPERYKNPVTAEDKAMKAAYDEITGYTETTYEPLPAQPLGLKPRKLYNEARIIDILEAMTRYVEAGKPVDQDWLDELNCLIMENQ